jgi:hypothetical protein
MATSRNQKNWNYRRRNMGNLQLAIFPAAIYVSSMKTNTYLLAVPPGLLKNLQPFTAEESRRCFATPYPEFDALATHCASLPVPIPEE